MSWEAKPLREVLSDIKTGSTPLTSHPEYFGGSIPWFTPSDIGSKKDLMKSSRYLSEEGTRKGKAKIFPKGSLLVTCIGNIGRVGVLQQPGSSNQQITSLLFDNNVNVDYAYYWFLANQKKLERQANQAVVPILNNERLEEIEFTYPSGGNEQERIATILGQADRLRRTRRFALELSETIVQAVFLEIFEACLSKEGSDSFREMLAIPLSNGSFETNDRYGSGSPVIWVDNLYHTFSIDLTKVRRAQLSKMALRKYEVAEGDLLFTRSSLVREGVGQINIVPKLQEKTAFECHIIRARVDRAKVNPAYILGLYRSYYGRRLIMSRANTATMTTISQAAIEELPCPIPPRELQDKFEEALLRFERLLEGQREAKRQAEHLFQTLLHRAFAAQN